MLNVDGLPRRLRGLRQPASRNVSAVLTQPAGYRSYLLRFWEERGDSPAAAVWRFSLEDPLTGRRHGFADLETLTAWLRAELAASAGRPGAADASPPE